ncbi:MAG: hypothetical protein BWK78_08595 [Thiotrichaceae bacterium IS1]|nr:MAG: hypothetical protein BWK78_08595 [Thiotrichaceae bacterium IS1]
MVPLSKCWSSLQPTSTLTGDCQAPATLENLKIKAGSHLSCVKLGKKVKLEKNVTVEKPK